jgi:hypothetical protein
MNLSRFIIFHVDSIDIQGETMSGGLELDKGGSQSMREVSRGLVKCA